MAQYLDKEVLVEKIEKRKKQNVLTNEGAFEEDVDILCLLDTLDVKEVDLEKEIEEHALYMPMSEFTNDGEVEDYLDWAREEFRHFYELGLKTKGE